MFFTPGVILTAALGLLCLLGTLAVWILLVAARVRRLSWLVSRATKRVPAPETWESRLAEVSADVVSLSSSFEKVAREVTRLNSRAGMREHRAAPAEEAAPPIGASKAELRKFYGLTKSGPEFARQQLSLVPKE